MAELADGCVWKHLGPLLPQENVGSERSCPVASERIQQQELLQRFTEWSGLELN